ncbi:unnamed protein product [Pleuronectes platessa]|uniref:Uncharacterized protein n=1 Tax=Pleuronectes platessa TaxID=8262 RepID=A0A9N7YTJ9_PLEPL|nr:unnamed protein product [Pleuronectes platessa]
MRRAKSASFRNPSTTYSPSLLEQNCNARLVLHTPSETQPKVWPVLAYALSAKSPITAQSLSQPYRSPPPSSSPVRTPSRNGLLRLALHPQLRHGRASIAYFMGSPLFPQGYRAPLTPIPPLRMKPVATTRRAPGLP